LYLFISQIQVCKTYFYTYTSSTRPQKYLALVCLSPTNQLTTEVTEDGDLRESASRRPSVCLAIPVF